ncbi:FtsQ-type POTRA domain-containing protein [Blastococcus sp. CCUG 61487]|uniref:cell division protein FtsQ/DivIB n=1 Tax=Blastococcus sp. CCUG 61487 TaxID=1840703 RepID=UPI0010BF9B91|nr:FtsQ-type POTRA domain-containing protein [Blastococcus sp. CCUG 61487]TKJ27895.1 cell division protein FtsQ [Blastococcus sp. CCUG 61487]
MSRLGTTTRDRSRGQRRRPAGRRGAAAVTPLRRRRMPARRRRVLTLALSGTLLVVLGWAVWSGPLLAVRSVQVDGVTTLPAELVRETAGVDRGTPLLRIDVEGARAAVADLPQVESVSVTRGWPDRVVITVEERTPLAVVGEAGRRSLVDARGVLFDSVSGEPPAGVVPLAVADPGPDDEETAAALVVIAALPAPLREQVAGVEAPAVDGIVLQMVDGPTVWWGSAEQSADKARILEALLEQVAAGTLDPADELDLSVPEAVVLR